MPTRTPPAGEDLPAWFVGALALIILGLLMWAAVYLTW